MTANPTFSVLTYFIMTSALHVGVFALMLYIYRTQKTYPGFGQWTLSPLIQAAAFITYGLYGITHPIISTLVPDLLFILSSALRLEGFLLFFDVRSSKKLVEMVRALLLVLSGLFATAFTAIDNAHTIILISSCMVLIFQALIITLLTVHAIRSSESAVWFLVGCHGLVATLCILRILNVSVYEGASLASSSVHMASAITLASVASLLVSVGVTILNNSRAHKDLALLHREMEGLASIDPLTGLRNRRGFMQVGEAVVTLAARHDKPVSLLMCDIDHFKNVNDTFGHDVGDRVLEAVAFAIQSGLRENDIAGRLGGEEFAILLGDTDISGAETVAEHIRDAVSRIDQPLGLSSTVTVSIGIADRHEGAPDLKSLLRLADEALYKAKHSGRNRWVLMPSPDPAQFIAK
ncbi:MAG TPA: GGDEF domain-containing protein [Capsulimonadaceae bacterium]|jgi:diguanylate cyclase (GGDEF)-like protein